MIFSRKRKTELQANGFSPKTFAIDKQKKIANWLSRKIERYSPVNKKTVLLALSVIFTALSVLVMAVTENQNLKNMQVNAPAHFPVLHQQPVHLRPALFTKSDYIRLEIARGFLDSLKKYDSLSYEELVSQQPQILEDIRQLESIYQSQKK